MNIVFMGTPDFAATILRHTATWPGGTVSAVYTQPDRPSGRGNKLTPCATKMAAQELGIPVFQPPHFRDTNTVHQLKNLSADVLVVAAYGLLLPQCVLDAPQLGAYNIHASLLPQHRVAAPIQRAVMRGDTITGITIMRMEASLDTGPILLQRATPLLPTDTAGTLFVSLAEMGGKLIIEALQSLAGGHAAFTPQNNALASYAPKIAPHEEWIPWELPCSAVHHHIQGLFPFPGARCLWVTPNKPPLALRVEPGEIIHDNTHESPGTIVAADEHGLVIACGTGRYRILRLCPAGKKTMPAIAFRNGYLQNMPYGTLSRPQA